MEFIIEKQQEDFLKNLDVNPDIFYDLFNMLNNIAYEIYDGGKTLPYYDYKLKIINNISLSLGKNEFEETDIDCEEYIPDGYQYRHNNHFEKSIMSDLRQANLLNFVRFLSSSICSDLIGLKEINDLLEKHINIVKFFIDEENPLKDVLKIDITILPDQEVTELTTYIEYTRLINRCLHAFENEDYSSVILNCASLFELFAKLIVPNARKNSAFPKLYKKYLTYTSLPKEIIDCMNDIYVLRNQTPNAAHGSPDTSTITKEKAITIFELTKAFIRIEVQNKNLSLS